MACVRAVRLDPGMAGECQCDLREDTKSRESSTEKEESLGIEGTQE
jgi:hypothetical protein